ncbi:LPP20 family lipoprotein [Helicobacter sp. 11S02629-2]|uniref:LPP20 family lipoprotein n=1 Tax=Helicobacter sp. 11S02629-2 TaxID=1476195 RepID=UPI000BA50901|nr:LPP20 family lipoprotein [Helicobacter sp. 11S02629-2]PAF45916.1 hypothetical protein BKH40_00450 [Helicobacter sp. 11S02629-2]
MKNKFSYFIVATVGALFILAGCASKVNNMPVSTNAPSWVNQTPAGLAAVDSAPIGNNFSAAMDIATMKARVQIAQSIATKIEQTSKLLRNQDGLGNTDEQTITAIRTTVSKDLGGAKRTNFYVDKDANTVWVLVEVQKLDTDLITKNLQQAKLIDITAAKAVSEAVDEMIDGTKKSPSTNSQAPVNVAAPVAN